MCPPIKNNSHGIAFLVKAFILLSSIDDIRTSTFLDVIHFNLRMFHGQELSGIF